MFGFFNVNKPSGPTSHDFVAAVRRKLPRGVKVGHAGTLDPFADGVLVLCVGPATRLVNFVQDAPKRYVAQVMLGATSSTDDIEGEITQTTAATAPEKQAVSQVLEKFVGKIDQIPPTHSAVHVNGQRAYKIARAGEKVELQAKKVEIYSIDLLSYEYPLLKIDVKCGSGTYIRSLARDIGCELSVGGYCSKLTRTEIGSFKIKNAVDVDCLDLQSDLISPLVALENLEKIQADEADVRRLALGQAVTLEQPCQGNRQCAVVDKHNNLVALANSSENGLMLKPNKVFV